MIYAFIGLAVAVLIALLCFSIFNARKNSGEYLMNMVLLTRYNRLLAKMSKKCGFKREDCKLLFQEKEDFSEKDLLSNIDTIQKIDHNFSLLKSMERNKSNAYEKLLSISPLTKIFKGQKLLLEFKGKSKRTDIAKILDLLNPVIIQKGLSEEVSEFFGNLQGWEIEHNILFLLKTKAVIIDCKDVFNCFYVDYNDLHLIIEKLGMHEVEYDGLFPLEDVDFRQEEVLSQHNDKGYEIITKVKCFQYILKIVSKEKTLEQKIHLMKTSDIEEIENYIKKGS